MPIIANNSEATTVSFSTPQEIVIDHADDSIKLGDGVDLVTTTTQGGDVGLDVNVLNELEIELDASDGDNVAISDGTNNLVVNPDGSINTTFVASPTVSTYAEVTSVPSSTPTAISSYTAPAGKTTFLQRIAVSGSNKAIWELKVNGITLDKKRTYFTKFDNEFLLIGEPGSNGHSLAVGDVVTIVATHTRSFVGDFNARIQSIEV